MCWVNAFTLPVLIRYLFWKIQQWPFRPSATRALLKWEVPIGCCTASVLWQMVSKHFVCLLHRVYGLNEHCLMVVAELDACTAEMASWWQRHGSSLFRNVAYVFVVNRLTCKVTDWPEAVACQGVRVGIESLLASVTSKVLVTQLYVGYPPQPLRNCFFHSWLVHYLDLIDGGGQRRVLSGLWPVGPQNKELSCGPSDEEPNTDGRLIVENTR